MCNLSELVKESAVKQEQIVAVERMLKADATKEQMISFGYSDFRASRSALAIPLGLRFGRWMSQIFSMTR